MHIPTSAACSRLTPRIRSSATPSGWSYVLTLPPPRFIVAKDVDERPGVGALVGEIHANICKALDCCAYVANGAVRDLPGTEAAGFQVFAGSIAASHAYAHVIEFGEPVEIGGLRIRSADLLQGDMHCAHSIPISISEIPRVVSKMTETENELIQFCSWEDFSLPKLIKKIQHVSSKLGNPGEDPI